MFLDGLIKIVVVALLLAHYARADTVTNHEMVAKVAKRGLSSDLHMSITEALYVAAVIIPSKEDPTRSVCSGFFLHEFWVATAASCFDGRKVRDRQAVVIFGVDDYNAETVNEVGSIHVWLHPEYSGPSKANDIALIKLRRSDKVQVDNSKIAKLHDYAYTYDGHDIYACMGLGFGMNIHNDTVLHFNLYEISYDSNACGCKTNEIGTLCGILQTLQEPCFTYIGGPLICEGSVVGIASTAYQCGTTEYDSLCARRTYFRFTYLCNHFRWISKYVPNFAKECNSWLSSAPAKSPFIIHHLSFIIFCAMMRGCSVRELDAMYSRPGRRLLWKLYMQQISIRSEAEQGRTSVDYERI
uniref:Peptidase S1 domain-containing protein n=1 Tax=Rhodnius prolixus TaxID=13249 RepID=T1IFK1_RHOPR